MLVAAGLRFCEGATAGFAEVWSGSSLALAKRPQLKLVRAAQVENCEPIKGKMTDHEVTWKGKSLG